MKGDKCKQLDKSVRSRLCCSACKGPCQTVHFPQKEPVDCPNKFYYLKVTDILRGIKAELYLLSDVTKWLESRVLYKAFTIIRLETKKVKL